MANNKFNGQRLKEALQFRGERLTDLAKTVEISKQSLSLYANGENVPPYENVVKIAKALNFPFDYFMTEDLCTTATDNTYFRSQASASKLAQNSQKVKLEYVAKIYEVFLNYVDFPARNIPPVMFFEPDNTLEADSKAVLDQIENIAESVRRFWKIGMGPIENMQFLLESNGIIVTGFRDVDEKIDAFSQRINVQNHGSVFVIALALGEKPDVRLRFDMGHELGHILLHDWDESNETLSRDEFNSREKQANMFASAFLLPRDTFTRDIAPYATNIDFYRSLKKKWGVSIQAMMYRARQLELITANQFQYMMRIISAKGWKTREPGDVPGKINSTIFQGAADLLFEGGYLSAEGLMEAFHEYGIFLPQKDLEDILGLKPGTLTVGPKVVPLVKPKFTVIE
ncbi:MAG: ImmA/IrrE family metallo-endopeptidase [Eubacteriales bacterium]|nr:ImmA/IrrE family metallo-endopeptidase [Eubacteriales bacterium]